MSIKQINSLKKQLANMFLADKTEMAKIDFIDAMLSNSNRAKLPNDYKKLLEKHNGIIAVPLEFYGCESIKRDKYNYKFPSILEINEIFKETNNHFMEQKVMLGSLLLDIIIFDAKDKKYKILNRLSFQSLAVFENLDTLLDYIITKL